MGRGERNGVELRVLLEDGSYVDRILTPRLLEGQQIVGVGIGFMSGLPSVIDEATPASARIQNEAIQVLRVVPGSPAEEAGIPVGAKIAAIDGRVFETAKEARDYIGSRETNVVQFTVLLEDGSYVDRILTPRLL